MAQKDKKLSSSTLARPGCYIKRSSAEVEAVTANSIWNINRSYKGFSVFYSFFQNPKRVSLMSTGHFSQIFESRPRPRITYFVYLLLCMSTETVDFWWENKSLWKTQHYKNKNCLLCCIIFALLLKSLGPSTFSLFFFDRGTHGCN